MTASGAQDCGGVDVGGAHLKAWSPAAGAVLAPFELWKAPGRLEEELAAILAHLGPLAALGVTMTAELCDCFATRRQGVLEIIAAVEAAARRATPRAAPETLYWTTASTLVGAAEARRDPLLCAASNWLALATIAGRSAPDGAAILIDVGSTTTDIVPILDGSPVPRGRDDASRLAAGELVYTGAARTPVCAVMRALPWRGDWIPVAAEVFATTRDAHLILRLEPEAPGDHATADGRPATRGHALARLARMLCLDTESFSDEDGLAAAAAILDAERRTIAAAARQVLARLGATAGAQAAVIVSGSGERLARDAVEGIEALRKPPLALSQTLGPVGSTCAPAYAVARLAAAAREGERSAPRWRERSAPW